MRRRIWTLATCFWLTGLSLQAADYQPIEAGPLHEAFVTQTGGTTVLQAIQQEPPAPLREDLSSPCDDDTDWIPGYWTWSDSHHEFIWVSGTWRRPPPAHLWIPGFWKKLDQGWVWIRGFWSAAPADDLNYIAQMPPESIQEEATNPPAGDHFWMNGYWAYSEADRGFRWHSGQWEPVDGEWVFVPAIWLWRPGGYLFVPSYWDYPVEKRGCLYPPVRLPPGSQSIGYHDLTPIESDAVIEWLLPQYPNYGYFFQQHYYSHRDFWNRFYGTPPWWAWPSWWALPWWDQWSLFWWWTHPGFPQPTWVNIATSTRIWPPTAKLLRNMEQVNPPFIVTDTGVVRPRQLLKEAARVTNQSSDSMNPILPSDPRVRKEIDQAIEPKQKEGVRPLRPSGRPLGPGEKPSVTGPQLDLKPESPPDKATVRPARLPPKPVQVKKNQSGFQGQQPQPPSSGVVPPATPSGSAGPNRSGQSPTAPSQTQGAPRPERTLTPPPGGNEPAPGMTPQGQPSDSSGATSSARYRVDRENRRAQVSHNRSASGLKKVVARSGKPSSTALRSARAVAWPGRAVLAQNRATSRSASRERTARTVTNADNTGGSEKVLAMPAATEHDEGTPSAENAARRPSALRTARSVEWPKAAKAGSNKVLAAPVETAKTEAAPTVEKVKRPAALRTARVVAWPGLKAKVEEASAAPVESQPEEAISSLKETTARQ